MKTILFSFLLVVFACSNDNSESEQFAKCESSRLRANIDEAIPAVVKTVTEGEHFYDGNRTYLEVDARTYLNTIADEDQITLIRIFAPSENLGDLNSNVMIKGSISECISGFHGTSTNDFKLFYLIENLSLTN